jgi:hypothetical protein
MGREEFAISIANLAYIPHFEQNYQSLQLPIVSKINLKKAILTIHF